MKEPAGYRDTLEIMKEKSPSVAVGMALAVQLSGLSQRTLSSFSGWSAVGRNKKILLAGPNGLAWQTVVYMGA